MASVTELCNRALIRLGADTITDITEDSKEGRVCNIIYNQVRKELLRSHMWNFATKRVSLAAEVTSPEFEFFYQYVLPSDCLRVVKMFESSYDWKIEGTKLLTNDPEPLIIYIADITDPVKFDALFSSLLVVKLAMELSYSITGATFVLSGLESEFRQLRAVAKLIDAQEGTPDQFPDGDWLDSR